MDFKHKGKDYAFDFNLDTIYSRVGIQTGILVINRSDLYPGKPLSLSDIPKNSKFFSDACSDWTIADNIDDDAAVNVAGQAVFTEHGGSNEEFFLDFADGDNRRAFPGLVIKDETGSSTEEIVAFMNIKTAVQRQHQFADRLKGTPCSNDGLKVYLVALDVQKISDNRDTAAITTAASGVATGIAGTIALAGSIAWMPVAGWIAGAVILTAGGVVAVWPKQITDIQQVMILSDPIDL